MKRFAMYLLFVFIVAFGWLTAHAQNSLIVNGRSVAGMSRSLVPGSVYAPAEAIAEALGAAYFYDPSTGYATFDYAAALLTVRVFSEVAQAAAAGGVTINGVAQAGGGGLLVDNTVYVPVRAVTEAFGGQVDLTSDTIIAVFPRAKLVNAYVASGDAVGSYERLVLEFEGLAPFESYTNATLNTLQLRFETATADAPQDLPSGYLERAYIDPSAGYLDVTIRPRAGYRFETYTAPRAGGTSVFVDIIPLDAVASGSGLPANTPAATRAELIVLDPGHGGTDTGIQLSAAANEGDLTLSFVQQLAARLESQGYQVQLTRSNDSTLPLTQRAAQGVSAAIFVSVHAAELAASQFNIYYLGDAAQQSSLDLAVRENAAAALERPNLDALRRRLLLQLVPDTALGAAYAQGIGDELLASSGYRANIQDAAPLAVLEAAAGRGILLEFSPADLANNAQLIDTLATAITAVLARHPSSN